jgi:putative DNA primase/helicase
MPTNLSGIPDHLKMYEQFVLWKLVQKQGETRLSKIPYNPHTGTPASSVDKATWGSFDLVKTVYTGGGYDGVGFVFNKDDPYIGIDFDHAIDPAGKLNNCAYINTSVFASYTEISQSGTGLHVIGIGKNPGGNDAGHKNGDIEFYTHGRFFALTGNVYNNQYKVNYIPQEMLQPFFLKNFPERKTSVPVKLTMPNEVMPKPATTSKSSDDLSDESILKICSKAKNSSKFNALWRGNISGYKSSSEADMALTSILSFYTRDANQIQRLLLSSGLNREKMSRPDYLIRTISKAISTVGETFKAKPKKCWFCKTEIIDISCKKCIKCGKIRRY